MQKLRPETQRQLTKWIAAVIVAILGALFGQDQLTGHRQGPQQPRTQNTRTEGAPTDARGPNADRASDRISGAARAIDGDSMFVGRDEVRMKGIDAPEGKQSCTKDGRSWDCGNAARDELRRLIGKDVVECRVIERDKHGRLLATCTAGGRDLNAGMVSSGMAMAYGGYLREQGDAKAKRRGLWGSEFQQPREWRHERGIGL